MAEQAQEQGGGISYCLGWANIILVINVCSEQAKGGLAEPEEEQGGGSIDFWSGPNCEYFIINQCIFLTG